VGVAFTGERGEFFSSASHKTGELRDGLGELIHLLKKIANIIVNTINKKNANGLTLC
jgi:hypothetical protein